MNFKCPRCQHEFSKKVSHFTDILQKHNRCCPSCNGRIPIDVYVFAKAYKAYKNKTNKEPSRKITYENGNLGEYATNIRQRPKDSFTKEELKALKDANFDFNDKSNRAKGEESFNRCIQKILNGIDDKETKLFIKNLPYHLEGLYGKRKYSEKEIQAYKDADLNVQSKKQTQEESLEKRKKEYKSKVDDSLKFIKQHKRKPKHNSNDPEENKLFHFLADNRKKYKRTKNNKKTNILEKWQIVLLETVIDLDKTPENTFKQNLNNTLLFYKKNNLYPSAKSKNEQERYLGEWVLTIRKQNKRGKLLPERKQILVENNFIFNWREHTFNMKLNKY